jgi:hypothetical protein
MKRLSTAAFIVLIFSSVGLAESPRLQFNGRFWQNLQYGPKSYFIVGFLEGLQAGAYDAIYKQDFGESADASRIAEAVNRAIKTRDKFWGKSTLGEVIRGLDQFYADPANALIPIHIAMQYFQARVIGADMAPWDAWVQNLRRSEASKSTQ